MTIRLLFIHLLLTNTVLIRVGGGGVPAVTGWEVGPHLGQVISPPPDTHTHLYQGVISCFADYIGTKY